MIEMPVYKESQKETITPSVYSRKKAMQTYLRQGGTATILIHDDGMQLTSDEDLAECIAFYADKLGLGRAPAPQRRGRWLQVCGMV
ncbi:hypothetical protein PHLGIDRAFT_467805 [Phlebiopsis gigantea 11061_1 CR5-6]|uniref:Uncharacterized protein n=1 Tax=Phlebiopsis gigantea (strain 11061_1 CR5-6) TaxID=745531 RepID=A0A0C3RWW3_PHLG1|nr:hypothetical protein PHLGIDRAFT_467805 [Phlebiopsis gigantea 11061_1 CR5-6]